MKLKIIMVTLCGIMASCTTTQSTPKPEIIAQKPTENISAHTNDLPPNVTLVRYNAMPTLLVSRMKVNGAEVARLKNKQYAKIYLPPGQHELKVAYAPLSFQPGTSEDITIETGKDYIFEVTSSTGGGIVNGYASVNTGISLKQHSPENFNIDLSYCCEDVLNLIK